MKSRKIFFIAMVVLLVLGDGCSSGEQDTPGKEVPLEPAHTIHTIEISQMKFTPAEITVKKGDEIVFVNHDIVNHDVTEESKAWSSSTLEPEKYWTFTATVSQNYYCSLHVVMKGSIKVE